MAKSDRDHAVQLLKMAISDHTALANMLEPKAFSEEVFGFHAQQAVEKTLKAWIAARRLNYPKTHDLSALIDILAEAGANLGEFQALEDYTIFAVQYRYEAYDEAEEALDRQSAIAEISKLIDRVRQVIDSS
jgi:HEPN domain-containing protein